MTQGNLGNLHVAFIGLPDENQRERYRQAIECVITAFSIFIQVGHAPFAKQAAGQLRWLSKEAGSLFTDIWQEMELGEMPEWLK